MLKEYSTLVTSATYTHKHVNSCTHIHKHTHMLSLNILELCAKKNRAYFGSNCKIKYSLKNFILENIFNIYDFIGFKLMASYSMETLYYRKY